MVYSGCKYRGYRGTGQKKKHIGRFKLFLHRGTITVLEFSCNSNVLCVQVAIYEGLWGDKPLTTKISLIVTKPICRWPFSRVLKNFSRRKWVHSMFHGWYLHPTINICRPLFWEIMSKTNGYTSYDKSWIFTYLLLTFNFAIIQIFSAFVWCILRLDKMERVVQWAYTLHLESENCQRSARIRDPTSWLVSLWPSGRNWAKDWSKSGLRGCPLISGSKWALG